MFTSKRLNADAKDFSFIKDDEMETVSKRVYSKLDVAETWFNRCCEGIQEEQEDSNHQEKDFIRPLLKTYDKMPSYLNIISNYRYPQELIEAHRKWNKMLSVESFPTIGYFSEIDMCWGIVQGNLFLWNTERPEFCKTVNISKTENLLSANLLKPIPNVFLPTVKYVIACLSQSQIFLISLSCVNEENKGLNSNFFEFELSIDCEFNAKTEKFTCSTATMDGKLFVGSENGDIYEVVYSKNIFNYNIKLSVVLKTGSGSSRKFLFSRTTAVTSPIRKLLTHQLHDRDMTLYAFKEDNSLHVFNITPLTRNTLSKIKSVADLASSVLSSVKHESPNLLIESCRFPLLSLPRDDVAKCLTQQIEFRDMYIDQWSSLSEDDVKNLSTPFAASERLPSFPELEQAERLLGTENDEKVTEITKITESRAAKTKKLYKMKTVSDIYTSFRTELIIFFPEIILRVRTNSPYDLLIKLLKIKNTNQDRAEFIKHYGLTPTLTTCLGLLSKPETFTNCLSMGASVSEAAAMFLGKVLQEFKIHAVKRGQDFDQLKSSSVDLKRSRDFMNLATVESFILLTQRIFCPFWKKPVFKNTNSKSNYVPDVNFEMDTVNVYIMMVEKLYGLSTNKEVKLSSKINNEFLDNIQRLMHGEMPIPHPFDDQNHSSRKKRRRDAILSSSLPSSTPSSSFIAPSHLHDRRIIDPPTMEKMLDLETQCFAFLSPFFVRVREALKLIQVLHNYSQSIQLTHSINNESMKDILSLTFESMVCTPRGGKLVNEILQMMQNSIYTFLPSPSLFPSPSVTSSFLQSLFMGSKEKEERKMRELVDFVDDVSMYSPSFFSSQEVKRKVCESLLEKAVKVWEKDEKESKRLVNEALYCWNRVPLGISKEIIYLMIRARCLIELVQFHFKEMNYMSQIGYRASVIAHCFPDILFPLRILVYCELKKDRGNNNIQEDNELEFPEIMNMPREWRMQVKNDLKILFANYENKEFQEFYESMKKYDVYFRKYFFPDYATTLQPKWYS